MTSREVKKDKMVSEHFPPLLGGTYLYFCRYDGAIVRIIYLWDSNKIGTCAEVASVKY
jgi:hypothetical protein